MYIFGSTQITVFQDIMFIGTSAPRHLGVLRKDAVPYISLIGIPKFIGTSTFIGTSAPRHLGVLRKDAVPYISLIVIPKIIGTSTFIGTSGTPSPTFRLSGYRSLSERQRLSGRQRLITSVCFARTPSPTISSRLPNKFRIAE